MSTEYNNPFGGTLSPPQALSEALRTILNLTNRAEKAEAELNAYLGQSSKDDLLPGDIEPHDDIERTVKVVRYAYGWTVDNDGRVCGLVGGDMGYESTHIVINLEELREALWLVPDNLKEAYETIRYLKDAPLGDCQDQAIEEWRGRAPENLQKIIEAAVKHKD